MKRKGTTNERCTVQSVRLNTAQISVCAQRKLTTVDPDPLNTELLLSCEEGQPLAT